MKNFIISILTSLLFYNQFIEVKEFWYLAIPVVAAIVFGILTEADDAFENYKAIKRRRKGILCISYLPPEESTVLLAVLALEEKYRVPIHLHYYEGYSIAEISKLLRCPAATIGSRLARGREKLKQELGEDYFEE